MKKIKYCSYSETIRLWPENRMLLKRACVHWEMDLDINQDNPEHVELAKKIAVHMLEHSFKYEQDPSKIEHILNN